MSNHKKADESIRTISTATHPARPLILRDWEVRGLLDGRVSQLRRPIKWCPAESGLPRNFLHDFSRAWVDPGFAEADGVHRYQYLKVPFAHPEDGWAADNPGNPGPDTVQRVYCEDAPGDLVWGREAWSFGTGDGKKVGLNIQYRSEPWLIEIPATHKEIARKLSNKIGFAKWKSPICMPQWASRLTLEVVSVRPERLQSITEGDAIASGSQTPVGSFKRPMQACWSERQAFAQIWDATHRRNAAHQWAASPWVWVRDVRVVSQSEVSDR